MGAVCFAVSDSMIAISRFILGNEALAVPIWWSYAAAQILITAGFFFGREHFRLTTRDYDAELTESDCHGPGTCRPDE